MEEGESDDDDGDDEDQGEDEVRDIFHAYFMKRDDGTYDPSLLQAARHMATCEYAAAVQLRRPAPDNDMRQFYSNPYLYYLLADVVEYAHYKAPQ